MSRWLLMPIMLSQIISLSYGAPTSLGPTSQEEAQILWKDGQVSYKESRYQDAINQLSRYVDRYPQDRGFLEAHFILGKSFFKMERTEEALKVLRYYVTSKGSSNTSAEAKIWLARCYIKLKKFAEAIQICLEIDQIKSLSNPEIHLEQLIIKSRALLGLKHIERASNAVDAAEGEISAGTRKELIAEIYSLKLQAKAESCTHFRARTPLDETQALSLADREGTCLLEALLIFNKVLSTGVAFSSTEAANHMNRAFISYSKFCTHPPHPKPIPDHIRTPEEIKSYRAELADRLLKNYDSNVSHALDLLNSWTPATTSPVFESFLLLSSRLKKTNSRNP